MRISKLLMPAVTLAGALALAGCGGGSSTTAAGPGGNDGGEEGDRMPASSGTLSALALPADADFEVTTATAREGAIPAGKYRDFGNVRVTCDGAVACNYEIREGKIFANNGAKAGPVPAPEEAATVENTATAMDHGETGLGWLSADALINAVKPDRTVELIRGNVRHPVDDDANLTNVPAAWTPSTVSGDFLTATNAATGGTQTVLEARIDVTQGQDTKVRLAHTRGRTGTSAADPKRADDYLVYGTWQTFARSGLDNPESGPEAEPMWAGSIPYVERLRFSTGSARYTGHAIGHYKSSGTGNIGATDTWEEWDGTVKLSADFTAGQRTIEGSVYTGIDDEVTGTDDDPSLPSLARIDLGRTVFTDRVGNGSADIAGSTDGGGSWKAEFYGTTAIQGQPSGIAGGFDAHRPYRTGTGGAVIQHGGLVHGAFGAHNAGALTPIP